MPVLWVDHGYNRAATYQTCRAIEEIAQAEYKNLLAENFCRASRRHYSEKSPNRAGRRSRPETIQRANETRTFPARHEGTGANGLDNGAAKDAKSRPADMEIVSEDKNFGRDKSQPGFKLD